MLLLGHSQEALLTLSMWMSSKMMLLQLIAMKRKNSKTRKSLYTYWKKRGGGRVQKGRGK
jgi:hypothetical protein